MKKKISFAFVLAMILVTACLATAVAGAVSESFNSWLYRIWPEAALKLMPVDLSCEDKGIRMDVLSAAVQDSEVLITYTLQDLEGDRLFEGVTEIYPQVSYGDTTALTRKDAEHYDETEHKLYSAAYAQYENRSGARNESLSLTVELFNQKVQYEAELFPYLREYGERIRMAGMPEGVVVRRPYVEPDERSFDESGLPEDMQVIDTAGSLEIPLRGTAYLSGVKIVDGWAHVQLHFPDNRYLYSENGRYRLYESELELYDTEDNDLPYADEALYNGCRVLYWGTEGRSDFSMAEWVEYIFPVEAAAVESAASLPVLIEEGLPPINASLRVQIPVRLVKGTR